MSLVYNILKNRIYDNRADLTIRLRTIKNNLIWCNVHYAFIDDFNEHYIYCTYTNVSVLKTYEERLRNVYTILGDQFYHTAERTFVQLQVNLTKDLVVDIGSKDLYPFIRDDMSYTE